MGRIRWTKDEDTKLVRLVQTFGIEQHIQWQRVAQYMGQKTARQCRERWKNVLNPCLNRGPWSAEEDQKLLRELSRLGNKWADIARVLPGRTDIAVKNRASSLGTSSMAALQTQLGKLDCPPTSTTLLVGHERPSTKSPANRATEYSPFPTPFESLKPCFAPQSPLASSVHLPSISSYAAVSGQHSNPSGNSNTRSWFEFDLPHSEEYLALQSRRQLRLGDDTLGSILWTDKR
eukprot:c17866_g1_i5.p1 GENE.c17866_g1_i5~~c17866_g1_i5.p1  ORF type:complete len:233 (+),score=29.30 c17866_g1_i5:79-777(+)